MTVILAYPRDWPLGEVASAIVDPYLVALATVVGDEGVEIAVAVEIGEVNTAAVV